MLTSASIAASLLAAAGRQPVAVDDEFGNAPQAGLPVPPRRRVTLTRQLLPYDIRTP